MGTIRASKPRLNRTEPWTARGHGKFPLRTIVIILFPCQLCSFLPRDVLLALTKFSQQLEVIIWFFSSCKTEWGRERQKNFSSLKKDRGRNVRFTLLPSPVSQVACFDAISSGAGLVLSKYEMNLRMIKIYDVDRNMVWTVKWRLLSTAAQGSPAKVCWLLSSTPTATAFRRGSDPRYLEFLDSTTWNLTSEICDSRTQLSSWRRVHALAGDWLTTSMICCSVMPKVSMSGSDSLMTGRSR